MSAAVEYDRQRRRFFSLCVAPSLAVLSVITLLPTLYLIATSFTPLDLTRPETAWNFSQPVANYASLVSDGRLRNSVWVQAKLSFWTVSLQLLIGLGFALLLNARSRFLEALRTVFLIPMVLPPIVVAIIWKVIYTPDISPMHWIFRGLGWNVPTLITDPNWALTAIIIADTWEWFPFTMLMVLAALQMIPDSPLEAAKIDGATRWQTFRFIVFPYIRQTLVIAGLFRLIDSIKAFPLIFVLTDGGPGDVTEVTNYYAYRQAFTFSLWGYGSAIATLMVAGIFLLSWIIDRMTGAVHAEAG